MTDDVFRERIMPGAIRSELLFRPIVTVIQHGGPDHGMKTIMHLEPISLTFTKDDGSKVKIGEVTDIRESDDGMALIFSARMDMTGWVRPQRAAECLDCGSRTVGSMDTLPAACGGCDSTNLREVFDPL
jgi:hypothetical protein